MNKEKVVSETKPQFAVFDWIVDLPIIRIIKPIYVWKRAFWIYCFLGFLSVVVNYVLTIVLANLPSVSATLANVIAFVVSTFVSFVLFRYFYFDRTDNSFFNELVKFTSARLFTFGFETVVIFIFVDKLAFNLKIIKAVLIPLTALMNYFISKLFVFKNKKV